MSRKDKKNDAAKEALESLTYVVEQSERLLEELKRRRQAREVTQFRAAPLPKVGT